MTLYGKSEIYMITNKETGKRYIGQVQCYKKNGELKCSEVRFKQHCYDAKIQSNQKCGKNLIESIKKYGIHNHNVKPIFICNSSQANYWEVKMIRKYNTLVPNGLNIMRGGKRCPLAEETKQKISESKKGKYVGELNPMWGKNHQPPTIEKIKKALTGKPLSEECKVNMSKAHQENKDAGKLPPRRTYNDLPKYIYHVKTKTKEGYEIRHHPTLRQKQFVKKTITLKENLQRAVAYLADDKNPKNQKPKNNNDIVKFENLPRYVRQVESEKYRGFEVKDHPKLSNKKWTSMKLTMEQKLKLAKDYLEESSETKSLSVNG